MLTPQPTDRLQLREMTDADLDNMTALLGDPEVDSLEPGELRGARVRPVDWRDA